MHRIGVMKLDPSVAIKLIILILLLVLSAFFSSAETALTTASRIRLQSLAESGNHQAKTVLKLTSNKQKMLSAILIGNNLVNLSASALSTTLAIKLWGNSGAGIATGILTLLILIFGEISPKTLATLRAEHMSLRYGGIIYGLTIILTPVIYIINHLALNFLKLFGVKATTSDITLSTNEIRTLVNNSHKKGTIEADTHDVINNMFDFREAQAKEIMIPRIDMAYVYESSSYEELIEVYKQDKFTRLPVYQDNSEDVVGIINVKDLLLLDIQPDFKVSDVLRVPYFTYEHKNIANLFVKMRNDSISMAIVLDEYGDTAGIITLEDLLEEIVGEIHDEFDGNEEEDVTIISDTEFQLLGSMDLDDLSELTGISIESEDYDSVAGYVFGLLDHLPEKGEDVTTEDGLYFRVESMDKNRIERLYLRLLPQCSINTAENN